MRRLFLFAACAFCFAATALAQNLRGNFWPNSSFEAGDSLDTPAGTPSPWKRGGSGPDICQVATIAKSPTHALAVVDQDNNYGEWYADVSLPGRVVAGDQLDLRWSELYDISGTEMRVTVQFLSSSGGTVGVKHFVVRGQSEGFTGDLATSSFVQRDETADVPDGAATLRVSLVSGGSVETTGMMIIDDLSVARHPAPSLLPSNIWTNNPTFELGTNLDQPTGELANWVRSGSLTTIDQVTMTNFISPGHALAVVDRSSTGYGEWYSDLPLSGVARAGDTLKMQWYELFNISSGEMRVTVQFLNGTGGTIDAKHFVARSRSAGYAGSITNSPFVKRNEQVVVPDGAATFRVSLVSGGGVDTTGTMIIDDFSMNKVAAFQESILPGNVWANPTFEQGTDLNNAANALPANWSRDGSDPSIALVSTNGSPPGTHALQLADSNPDGYGEWHSDLVLGAAIAPGKLLNLQWLELYSVTNGEMRLSFTFFNSSGQVVGESHFVAQGDSVGWKGQPAGSSPTLRNEQISVPLNAARLRASLVSGGAADATGVMIVDDLSVAPDATAPVTLVDNFWPDPGLESVDATGKPEGWQRTGSNNTVQKVLDTAYTSSTHSLALVDTNTESNGNWTKTIPLPATLKPGDLLAAQWWEMFNVDAGGQMLLSSAFLDAGGSKVGGQDFTAAGQSSLWNQDPSHSFFTKRNETLTVPANATQLSVTFSSGAAPTTGVYLIDDLSFGKPPAPPELLSGNFWPNSTFEEGVQLDKPSVASPAGGWNRGGTYIPGDQITTVRAKSPIHALGVFDTKTDAYSEWYVITPLSGLANPGETLDVQWFELFDTQGDMRLSFLFRGADNSVVGQTHFVVHGQSEGWTGDLATSPFVKRLEQVAIPDGAVSMMVTLASGGSETVTGTMIIDDLSIRNQNSGFQLLSIATDPTGQTLRWESRAGKTYAIESASVLGQFQPVPGLDAVAADPSNITSVKDTRTSLGKQQFYRIREVQ